MKSYEITLVLIMWTFLEEVDAVSPEPAETTKLDENIISHIPELPRSEKK